MGLEQAYTRAAEVIRWHTEEGLAVAKAIECLRTAWRPKQVRIVLLAEYPSRPITIVVGFASGGATDTIGRIFAERMKSSLGQPVIVENVTGAGGTIAVGRVARAAPDGYTLSLGSNSPHVVTGATYTLHYDLLNDFEPVALLSTGPFVCSSQERRCLQMTLGV
jgi:tripartite-type tricarboxylate transporter receptor subunit TctC